MLVQPLQLFQKPPASFPPHHQQTCLKLQGVPVHGSPRLWAKQTSSLSSVLLLMPFGLGLRSPALPLPLPFGGLSASGIAKGRLAAATAAAFFSAAAAALFSSCFSFFLVRLR